MSHNVEANGGADPTNRRVRQLFESFCALHPPLSEVTPLFESTDLIRELAVAYVLERYKKDQDGLAEAFGYADQLPEHLQRRLASVLVHVERPCVDLLVAAYCNMPSVRVAIVEQLCARDDVRVTHVVEMLGVRDTRCEDSLIALALRGDCTADQLAVFLSITQRVDLWERFVRCPDVTLGHVVQLLDEVDEDFIVVPAMWALSRIERDWKDDKACVPTLCTIVSDVPAARSTALQLLLTYPEDAVREHLVERLSEMSDDVLDRVWDVVSVHNFDVSDLFNLARREFSRVGDVISRLLQRVDVKLEHLRFIFTTYPEFNFGAAVRFVELAPDSVLVDAEILQTVERRAPPVYQRYKERRDSYEQRAALMRQIELCLRE